MAPARHLPTSAVALLALVLLCAEGVEAQRNERIRQGFFFGAGLGYTSLELPDEDEARTRAGGMLRVGGSLTPRILVGVESLIYAENEPANTLLFVTLTPTLWFYPLGDTPLFVKAGVGFAVLELDRGLFGGNNNDGGLGVNAGLGWDFHITDSFGLTPYATWARGRLNPGDADMWQVGVGLTGF